MENNNQSLVRRRNVFFRPLLAVLTLAILILAGGLIYLGWDRGAAKERGEKICSAIHITDSLDHVLSIIKEMKPDHVLVLSANQEPIAGFHDNFFENDKSIKVDTGHLRITTRAKPFYSFNCKVAFTRRAVTSIDISELD